MANPARNKRLTREFQECQKDVSIPPPLALGLLPRELNRARRDSQRAASRFNRSETRSATSPDHSPGQKVRHKVPHVGERIADPKACVRETGTSYEGGRFVVDIGTAPSLAFPAPQSQPKLTRHVRAIVAPPRYPFEPLQMKFITKASPDPQRIRPDTS